MNTPQPTTGLTGAYPPPPPPPGAFHQPPPPPGPQPGSPMPTYRLSRPRTNIWRVLGLLIFVGVIGFNLLIMLAMFGGAGMLGGGHRDPHGLVEYRREAGEGGKIAVISIEGVIMEGGGGGLFGGGIDPVALAIDSLNRAQTDPDVRAVILEVNSPGGGVTASDYIHHEILKFRESGKPVVVYMKDLAASGGYYVSAPADWIVASPTTLTGSIGVVIQGFNFHGTLTEVVKGQDATIKAGGNKTMGSMFADPESEEYRQGRQLLQDLADEMHGKFKQIVKDGRGGVLQPDWETYADGRILSAEQAKKVGLVDQIGYFEDAKAKAEELVQLKGLTVVEYGRDVSLGALLGLGAEDVQPRVEKAVGEQLSAELQEQLRLYPGRPMAIWVP